MNIKTSKFINQRMEETDELRNAHTEDRRA